MDPADPRARRVAAAARSPFPALRKYAERALAESDPPPSSPPVTLGAPQTPGYYTDPDDPVPRFEPELDPEFEPEPAPFSRSADSLRILTAPRYPARPAAPPPPSPFPSTSTSTPTSTSHLPQDPPPSTSTPDFTDLSDRDPSPERPLRNDLLLGTAVAFLAFVLIRPLVPTIRAPAPAASVVPWHLIDRSGGATLQATVGAPVTLGTPQTPGTLGTPQTPGTSLPLDPHELAIEIPLPDPSPAPSSSSSSPPSTSTSPAAVPPKRVGVWLTVRSPSELAQIYTALSRHHLERENWDQARYYADKVLGTWPDNTDARRLREAARKGLGVRP